MLDRLIENFIRRKVESSLLLSLLSSPDDHTYQMQVENDEIVIRIKRKEKRKLG